jgi:hypothetical protein
MEVYTRLNLEPTVSALAGEPCELRTLAALVIQQALDDLLFATRRLPLSEQPRDRRGGKTADQFHPNYGRRAEEAKAFLTGSGAHGEISRYWFACLDQVPLTETQIERVRS